jgi:hypothetical protein
MGTDLAGDDATGTVFAGADTTAAGGGALATSAGAGFSGNGAGAGGVSVPVAAIGGPELKGCRAGVEWLLRFSVSTWSGSFNAAAVLEPALAAFGPTCSTRVCISPLGSGAILVLAESGPEFEPGNSIGTKITASAISTAAPSSRFFKPESIGGHRVWS